MYESFFGLQKKPFSLTPDPDFLYLTGSNQEALAGITYTVLDRKGFAVITGEAGSGKTTILSTVISNLSGSKAYFSWILNPLLTASEFFELALLDLGIADVPVSKALRIIELQKFLLRANTEGKTTVLIIDEAHKLDPQLLEEIRLLTNFESGTSKLLQIVLAGQPELDDLLERKDLRQLKQRIAVRMTVKPLDPIQVRRYIAHRWIKAGGSVDLPFESTAITAIDEISGGIPRLVNSICDSALLLAYATGEPSVRLTHINSVAADLHLTSFVLNQPQEQRKEADNLKIPAPEAHVSAQEIFPVPTFGQRITTKDESPRKSFWAARLGLKYKLKTS